MAATLAVAIALTHARALAMRDWLDTGTGNAAIEIFGSAWPGGGNTGTGLLATVELTKPCGTATDGVLTLASAAAGGDMIMADGEACWCRIKNAAGAWALDGAITVAANSTATTPGLLRIAGAAEGPNKGVLLYAGGKLPALSLKING